MESTNKHAVLVTIPALGVTLKVHESTSMEKCERISRGVYAVVGSPKNPGITKELLPFTKEEMLVFLEAARLSLGDADIAEEMDLADDYLLSLWDKLHQYLDGKNPDTIEVAVEEEER
ncbi:MAG: hypothetical protein ACLQF0_06650 [Dissulfurispiraceae bacterium]